jgi:hypothetical protein
MATVTYATGTEAARETREIEGALEHARRLNDIAAKAVARTTDMKHRLLGLVEPQAPNAKDGPKPVPCELTELRQLLQSLDGSLDRLHENLTTLERV